MRLPTFYKLFLIPNWGIDIHPEYYDCFGKFTGSPLDRHEFQGLELQLISR